MKVDEDVRWSLVRHLEYWRRDLFESLGRCIRGIEAAETVEEIMWLEKVLLSRLVESVPPPDPFRYFCSRFFRYLDSDCVDCPYGTVHGRCIDRGSDWHKIQEARVELWKAVRQYYRDEQYR